MSRTRRDPQFLQDIVEHDLPGLKDQIENIVSNFSESDC